VRPVPSSGSSLPLISFRTGTAAGDPIEARAISHGICRWRTSPLYVGSVKTNLGHTEAASGLAAIIKVVLSLERGTILPNLNFENPSTSIDFDALGIKVPTERIPWPIDSPRLASINSFGYGGTNAHVILEDARKYEHPLSPTNKMNGNNEKTKKLEDIYDRKRLMLLSTHEEGMLQSVCNDLAKYVAKCMENPPSTELGDEAGVEKVTKTTKKTTAVDLDDLAYTLCERRSRFNHRRAIVVDNSQTLLEALNSTNWNPVVSSVHPSPIIFVFTGQGAQWCRMGGDLVSMYPTFSSSLERADLVVRSLGADWSLTEELMKDEAISRINQASVSQPACTAVQLALVDLLSSFGIRPNKVVGHSSGEIAAVYAAGALSFESAMRVAYFRGLHSERVKDIRCQGQMIAVELSAADAVAHIATIPDDCGKVVIACVNSPTSVTISGDVEASQFLLKSLKGKGVIVKLLTVDTAYHSHHMDAVAEGLRQSLQGLEIKHPLPHDSVEMISTLTGEPISPADLGAEHWVKSLLSCVQFSDAMFKAYTGYTHNPKLFQKPAEIRATVIEIGPHCALKGYIRRISSSLPAKNLEVKYFPSLIRNQSGSETIMGLCGALLEMGYPVDAAAVNCTGVLERPPRVLCDLPHFPWNHDKEFWAESRLSKGHRFRRNPRHDLLGAPVRDWNPRLPCWRHFIRVAESPWLKDHQVQGSIVYPAAGYMCMAFEALQQLTSELITDEERRELKGLQIQEMTINRALLIPEDDAVETVFSLENTTSSLHEQMRFNLHSVKNDSDGQSRWILHSAGRIQLVFHNSLVSDTSSPESSPTPTISYYLPDFYAQLARSELYYGPMFQNIKALQRADNGSTTGYVQIPDTKSVMPQQFESTHLLHPATLDSLIQTLFASSGRITEAYVPNYVENVFVSAHLPSQAGHKIRFQTTTHRSGFAEDLISSITGMGGDEAIPMIHIEGLQCVSIARKDAKANVKQNCFKQTSVVDVTTLSLDELNSYLAICSSNLPSDSGRVAELEALAFHYLVRAMRQARDVDRISLAPHLQKYFVWLETEFRERLEASQCEEQDMFATLDKSAQSILPSSELTEVSEQLLQRVGNALTSILKGETEPFALLFQDDLMYKAYSEAQWLVHSTAHLANYMYLLSFKKPNLHIMEIGAGTAGTTFHALSAMSRSSSTPLFSSYTFTDISSGFFEKAQSRLKQWGDVITYRTLDIEKNVIAQDFKGGDYDVVIASNVLHATANIEMTLRNTRTLLKTGGQLVLLEITNPSALRVALVYGTLPGWWLSEESYRQRGPTLTEQQWVGVLQRTGFGPFRVSVKGHLNPSDAVTQVLVVDAIEPRQLNGLPSHILRNNSIDCKEKTEVVLVLETQDSPGAVLGDHFGTEAGTSRLVVTTITDGNLPERDLNSSVVILYNTPKLLDISSTQFSLVQKILQKSRGVIWITTSCVPDQGLVKGLLRTLRSEHEGKVLVTISLYEDLVGGSQVIEATLAVIQQVLSGTIFDFEYEQNDDGRLEITRYETDSKMNHEVARLAYGSPSLPIMKPMVFPSSVSDPSPLSLEIRVPGLLDTFFFREHDHVKEVMTGEVMIEINAVGMNFQDVMTAMGQIPNSFLGLDCSGKVLSTGPGVTHLKRGDRVITWTLGAYRSIVTAKSEMVHVMPETMSYSRAASLPMIFSTAYYSLHELAQVKKGDTVLIHSGAGGVGQAAIQLCQLCGAELFVTVGSEEKKEFIMQTFGISESRIFSSRDVGFVEGIRKATSGKGVDIILNSLSGDLLHATWECIAEFGRFIELGKKDIRQQTRLNMNQFSKNVTFASADLTLIFRRNLPLAARILVDVMGLIKENAIHAIEPIHEYSFGQTEAAFRFMQGGKGFGKVVVLPKEGEMVPVSVHLYR
jgi:acyl transferase domain-containing protein/NADPH:quinone reductase-like Zn-dependent oxidoreductase/ubiquinone/menaquinone biosynthesis C-methylase UbiE